MIRKLIFLTLALLMSVASIFLVRSRISVYREQVARMERSLISVTSATRDIPAFTTLSEGDLKSVKIPLASVPEGEKIFSLAELIGKATVVPLSRGDLILSNKVTMDPAKLGLAFQLNQGSLAIAIPVNEVRTVGGLVQPGDYVDILHSVKPEDDRPLEARLLLSRVRVLAMGGSMIRPSQAEVKKKAVSRTAVIEVTPEDAAVAAWAQSKGELWMALRPARDEKPSSPVVYRGPNSVPVPVVSSRAKKFKRVSPRGWVIEMIEPGRISRVSVSGRGN